MKTKFNFLVSALALLVSVANAALAAPPDDAEQTLPRVTKPFMAPDFTLRSDEGETYHLADFRGKVVVLNFWATWCPPCRREMPSMERAYPLLKKDGIEILAVNVGETEEAIFAFSGRYPVKFPLLMDPNAKVVEQYHVTGLPTTYIIDPAGMVTYSAVGGREWDSPAIVKTLRDLRKTATSKTSTSTTSKPH